MVARLDALFTPSPTKDSCPIRGVYPHRSRYRACFKMGGVRRCLGTAATPTAAAEIVADEYDYWYGPGWWRWLSPDDRKRKPWRPVRWAAPAVSDPADPAPRTVVRPPPEPRSDPHPRIFDPGRPRQVMPAATAVPPQPAPWRPAGCRLAVGGCEAGRHAPWPAVGWALEVCEWGRPTVAGDHVAGAPAADWPTRRRVWVWPTSRDVMHAYAAWRAELLPRRWGVFAAIANWR